MKFIIVFTLCIAAAYSEIHCNSTIRGTLSCQGLELKADEPLDLSVNTSFRRLAIYDATGSIGIKTFSLLPQLVALEIGKNQISQIEDGALCSLPNLYKLHITGNEEFPVLTESLFTNCENITTLYLKEIQMEQTALNSMPNLEKLEFDALEVERFTKEYLEPLKKLKSLEFFNCKLQQIEAGAICLSTNLEKLMFIGNRVLPRPNKSVFENCRSVIEVTYEYNTRSDVDEEVFSGFDNLRLAIFDNINVEHLSKNFLTGLNTVELLGINFAGISTINANSFSDFVNLKKLILTGNNLTEFDSAVITDLTGLLKLDLVGNYITNIDNIEHTTLKVLIVSMNPISEVNAEAVKSNLPNLKVLIISGNKMSHEEEDLLKNKLEGIRVFGTNDKLSWRDLVV